MKQLAYIITLLGLLIYVYSTFLEPYTNEEEYNSRYLEIKGDDRTEQFYTLRDEYLTMKYSLIDYGFTAIILGFIMIFIFRNGWSNFKSLPSKNWIKTIGFVAVLSTIICYVGDLFNEYSRGSYPHWADSLGIPLMSVVPMLIVLSVWYGLNLLGIKGNFKYNIPISSLRFNKVNYGYLIISILTLIIIILVIIDGYFWMLIPGFLWLYFYISILTGRREEIINK